MAFRNVVGLLFLTAVVAMELWPSSDAHPELKLPQQFQASLEITAHLVDPAQSYPPRERHMNIYYDHPKHFARAEITQGYDAGKVFIRRYDTVRGP